LKKLGTLILIKCLLRRNTYLCRKISTFHHDELKADISAIFYEIPQSRKQKSKNQKAETVMGRYENSKKYASRQVEHQ